MMKWTTLKEKYPTEHTDYTCIFTDGEIDTIFMRDGKFVDDEDIVYWVRTPERDDPGWIDILDKYPDKKQLYFGLPYDDDVSVTLWNGTIFYSDEITHWMALPKR